MGDSVAAERAELVRYASRLTGQTQAAEDVVQDAYARVLGGATEIANPLAYLKRTIANLLADGARRRARGPQVVAIDEQIEIADPKPSPLRVLLARDAIREFMRLLGMLPPRSRQVFMMSRVDGMTYSMIGAQLGISIKAVEKHMARAIAHFDRTAGDLL
ncbi:RNA polymerase sigma factor [Sphingomonas cavernae]|uniref:RNA polymerase sigma factor n=1 Tax=Sphingomonas cavernae TaxID=2320861 RepID=UPI001603A0A0|nr:sigma-70 family RNA polymerase sigma factor [Sphingomonas cavernae]